MNRTQQTLAISQPELNPAQEKIVINRLLPGAMSARLTTAEQSSMQTLRTKYQSQHHVFSEREMARLRFLHWRLHQPGWDLALDRAGCVHMYAVPLTVAVVA